MKKFEIRPVEQVSLEQDIKRRLRLAAAVSLGGLGIVSCIGIPVVGLPAVVMVSKEITAVNSAGNPIPGLSVKLSPVDIDESWGDYYTDASGKAIVEVEEYALPLEIEIRDIDGATNGSYADKDIPFDDGDAETVTME